MKFSHTVLFLSLLFTFSVNIRIDAQYNEKYRPQFHLSSRFSSMADPKGLFVFQGKYNLFWYGQWEHAVSRDLLHWKQLPKPMKGAPSQFSYFSGSVVVDKNNTSGFGKNSVIAIYTRHFPGDSLAESQAISVSNNGGLEFNYYPNNPIIDIHKKSFRDPQVFWYKPARMWKMVVALPTEHKIQIYQSSNLRNWEYCSSFGDLGAKNSAWECPDLFEVPILDSPGKKKWVMMVGRGPNKVQYFIGNFDGITFLPDRQIVDYLENGIGLIGSVYDDFESGGFHNWKNQGFAFLPTRHNLDASDYLGTGYAGNLSEGNLKGRLISKSFTITHRAINFLIAGGRNPDSLSINLVVDGKVRRRSTGDNTRVFKWDGWDVHDWKGKKAHFEIIDLSTASSNASIAVDHIMFSSKVMNLHLEQALWLDYGDDFYAARTWRNYDDKNSLGDSVKLISWLGNWKYARIEPTSWGTGFQSIPRNIALKWYPEGYRIVQDPIRQLQQLRKSLHQIVDLKIEGTKKLEIFKPQKNAYELKVEFKKLSNAKFGFQLMVGEGRKLVLTIDPDEGTICLDRTNCSDYNSDSVFTKAFATRMYAPLRLKNPRVRLHIFVDQSSVEVFVDDGEVVLSALTFPSEKQLGINIFSKGGPVQLSFLKAWEVKSIWSDKK